MAFYTDVVGVFTQGFQQVFKGARPIKATVRPPSRLMEHPIETGAIVADHRIIIPIDIELSMVLQAADYKEAYREIAQLFANATLLIVQTKAAVYRNQVIMELPHEEDALMYDALSMGLKLRQVQIAGAPTSSTNGIVPANVNYQASVSRGQIQGSPTTSGSIQGGNIT